MDSYLKFYILNLKYSNRDFNHSNFLFPILILKNRQLLDAISSRSDYSCRWMSNFFILENATASTVLCEFVVNDTKNSCLAQPMQVTLLQDEPGLVGPH